MEAKALVDIMTYIIKERFRDAKPTSIYVYVFT